jgi:pyridoxine/pyridoxamine 5'-phosphate oxidase
VTPRDPLALLLADRGRALELRDPCASLCTLASVDHAGHPHARTVVLREIGRTLAVFSNRTSPKWLQLEQGPAVAVVVWLPTLNLQYRLQCRTRPVPPAIVQDSWLQRPAAPKRLDWYYTQQQPQGAPVPDRATLLERLAALPLPEPLTAPDTAGGLFLDPLTVDRLDLAQAEGIHDRRRFELLDNAWVETALVP